MSIDTDPNKTPCQACNDTEQFTRWYDECVSRSYNIGPVNANLVLLWSNIKNKQLSEKSIHNIVNDFLNR